MNALFFTKVQRADANAIFFFLSGHCLVWVCFPLRVQWPSSSELCKGGFSRENQLLGVFTASLNNSHGRWRRTIPRALLQGCRLDVALWEPTGSVFAVSWIRHLAMACGEMFAVHTICVLQLSCPLPRGPQPRRTDLDPHVTLSHSDQLHIYSFFLVWGLFYYHFIKTHQVSVFSELPS